MTLKLASPESSPNWTKSPTSKFTLVKVEYKPLEKKHRGKISDISAEGCCLETELPIRANQYIYIEVEIAENKTSKIFGKIVAVEVNNSTNQHILHIKFVKIDKTTRNSIYSLVYNY